MIGGCSFEARN